jgi:AcrR family transcriptional regulator
MRDAVASIAIQLFAEHGFDGVTTNQIAQAAGISPRSFFRYFPTKEDVVLGSLQESGIRVRDALVARPPTENAWEAMRQALRVLIENPVYTSGGFEAIADIILNTPSVRARDSEKYLQWESLLAPNIAGRLIATGQVSNGEAEASARALIGAATVAMRVTTEQWLRGGGHGDPLAMFDDLLAVIRSP